MIKTKKKVVDYIVSCYDFVEQNYVDIFNREKYFIVSNRGTFAFISILGSLNKFLTSKKVINICSSNSERFNSVKPYLNSLMKSINALSDEEIPKQLSLLGAGADIKWLRFFQSLINSQFSEYNPIELIDWKERQNEAYLEKGRRYVKVIERYMKKVVLKNTQILFGKDGELEINKIKTVCQERANNENEKNYKEGVEKRVEWTEMFSINDYKTIIEKYWTKKPEIEKISFNTFQEIFSINIGSGKNKKDVLKWVSLFNSCRNHLAHEGSKEKGINKKEVEFLEYVFKSLSLDKLDHSNNLIENYNLS